MPPPNLAPIAFAAVPYVRTVAPVALGPWKLWPNSKADWLRETGVDLTWLMRMYRDRQARAVGLSGSVLTRTDKVVPEIEDTRRAVVALSTIAWLEGTRSADAWVFDLWTVEKVKRKTWFVRSGKFTNNLTNPMVERIYPSPYSSPVTLGNFVPGQISQFLEAELKMGAESSVLRALSQMHEIRFETPYQTSAGNDLEALWTAFEAFYLARPSPGAQAPERDLISRLLGQFLAPRPRPLRRSERVVNAIVAQLDGIAGIRPAVHVGIAELIEKLWVARNAHSHGGDVQPVARIERLEAGVWSAGLQLFEALLKMRIAKVAGDEIFFLPASVEQLNEIFLRHPTYTKVVAALAGIDARRWYSDINSNRAELERLNQDLSEFVSFKRVDGWANRRDVAKACGLMRRVLSSWSKDLVQTGAQGDDVTAISGLPELDASMVKEKKARGLKGAALEDAIDGELVPYVIGSELHCAPEHEWVLGAPPLGGVIPLWRWARAYIRLHELFLGYALV